MKKKTDLELVQAKTANIADATNQKIEELGKYTNFLNEKLTEMQHVFDMIRNKPSDKKIELEELKKIRLNWIKQVRKIEADYNATRVKSAGAGVSGVGVGVTVAAMGPTAAMGIATTFGVASTGTAISSLSGIAATNAALAWIGGGTLATGGGGMAAGTAFLTMAGPVGWGIATIALAGSGTYYFLAKNEKKRLENIFISIGNRDIKNYQLAIVELNERIERIKEETKLLSEAILSVKTFGRNYDEMTEEQQYQMITFFNLTKASTQLLVREIKGLQPHYAEKDIINYKYLFKLPYADTGSKKYDKLYLILLNLLHNIEMDEKDIKVFWKTLKKNKEFLESVELTKEEFKESIIYNTEILMEELN